MTDTAHFASPTSDTTLPPAGEHYSVELTLVLAALVPGFQNSPIPRRVGPAGDGGLLAAGRRLGSFRVPGSGLGAA